MTPNPINQGIQLSNTLGALQALVSACDTVDPEQKDGAVTAIRDSLNDQIRRYKAELAALVSLYGGANAG
jgi:hypothetical protein